MGKHHLICTIDFTFLMLCLLHPSAQSYDCELSMKDGLYTADCSYRKLSSVPKDLDPSISVLILTGNRIDSWLKTSFVRYPNLKELYINSNRLSYIGFIPPIDNFTFSTLTELEVLDVRNMDLYSWKISLPKTIRVLYLSDNNLKNNPTFTKYANLEILNMSHCNLIHFPMLNEDAPIRLLEFGGNKLDNFTVADLASFCQLEYLGLDWPMSMASEWCECTKVKNWLEKFRIPSSLTYCPKSYVKTKTCDLKFEKHLIARFETCQEKLPQKIGFLMFMIIFGVLIAVAVLATITAFYLRKKPERRTLDVDNTLRGNNAEPDFEEEFELETEEEE